ncbi:ComEC/Rec2 family competence protein [Rothia sp. ZJ932]|uniref:ComEC/Rec2 family competence protein n=1 Tax=Rothia sp. ZJ932 TaxID=2810516 RepID=UPI00196862A4|nr:MBL fold metallo-hydrolase [Rothia sp. ZJ932]QRZ60712.1 MBL fold metallo-hydrolase [Rothia sp. ZJ932]
MKSTNGGAKNHRLKTTVILWTIAAVVGIIAGLHFGGKHHLVPPQWAVITCDVGQGSAALLRTDDNSAVLIDTGDSPDALTDCLRYAGVERIDAVILTHNHSDHVGALSALPRELPLYTSKVFGTSSRAAIHLAAGDTLSWQGSACQLTTRILAPFGGQEPAANAQSDRLSSQPYRARREGRGDSASENNASLVSHTELMCAGSDPLTYLAPGDLEEEGVRRLLATSGDLSADVVAVPHHGSKGSGTALYRKVQPTVALISAGTHNDYGHPHREITDHLTAGGVALYNTAHHGHIALYRDTDQVRLHTSK